MNPKHLICLLFILLFTACKVQQTKLIFEEINGIVAVEAEHFINQEKNNTRKWVLIDAAYANKIQPDHDPCHASDASGGQYLEILPDTRKNHDEKLIAGENFSNEPGQLGILHYSVYFNNPGKYYVWVRAFSTGSEDNGLHVGLDGEWVDSGRRMQWCDGKNQWTWESKQRTKEQHCGVEKQIFLQIDQPGLHTISFSMREDGFEFDKWMLTREYERPTDMGEAEQIFQPSKKRKP